MSARRSAADDALITANLVQPAGIASPSNNTSTGTTPDRQDATSGPTEAPAPQNAVLVAGREDTGDLHALVVDGAGNVGVNVVSLPLALPLPTGASTEATLALIKAKTDNLDVALSTRTKPTDTQPVSGAFFQSVQPVSATALPLPTGAALETGNLATLVVGASAAALASAEAGTTSGPTESPAPPNAVLVGGREDSGDFHALNVDGAGNLGVNIQNPAANLAQEGGGNLAALLSAVVNGSPVSVTSQPLPPGASTEGGNLALLTQALGELLAENRRHTVLLRRILGATGNDVPDQDTIDNEVQGSGQSWQLQ